MDNGENQSVETDEFTVSPDELIALVTKRINQGISREKIVQELVSQGNEQARIEPVVYAIYESLLQVAEQERVTTGSVIGAIIGGGGAAVICAIAWVALIFASEREFGLAAWAIGGIVGFAVRLVSGNKRGRTFQIIAAACSFFGVALAKGIMLAIIYLGSETGEASWTMVVGGFDILWLILAVGTSWRMLRGTGITVLPPQPTMTATGTGMYGPR
jgi:hypothetical protein